MRTALTTVALLAAGACSTPQSVLDHIEPADIGPSAGLLAALEAIDSAPKPEPTVPVLDFWARWGRYRLWVVFYEVQQ